MSRKNGRLRSASMLAAIKLVMNGGELKNTYVEDFFCKNKIRSASSSPDKISNSKRLAKPDLFDAVLNIREIFVVVMLEDIGRILKLLS